MTSPADGVTEPEPEPVAAGPLAVTDDGFRRWSAPHTVGVSAILVFLIGVFAWRHRMWPVAFWHSSVAFLRDPSIGSTWTTPARLPVAALVVALVGIEGWLAATALVRGSAFERDRPTIVGLSAVFAIAILGFAATVTVAVGRLAVAELIAVLVLIGGGIVVLRGRRGEAVTDSELADDGEPSEDGERAGEAPGDRPAPRERLLSRLTWAVILVSTAFTFAHGAFTPVTEWDATIYHAEVARVWFLERPDPALRFGPSIGIEISGNYPPLFPAAGAAMYTLTGTFDDIYLRVMPPLLFGATLLMVLGYARRRFDHLTATIAVLLVAGSPLTLAYGAWTTAYALVGALLLATVIAVDIARERDDVGTWAGAGVVAGLAILAHFYGLLAVFAGVAALVPRRSRPWRALVVFGVVAIGVAAPWLVRNLVRLGDPFYPLGSPPFWGKGLMQPLWDASKFSIKNAALAYWGYIRGGALALRLISTSLFDTQVLLSGAYLGLWFGLLMWRRSWRVAYLSAFLVAVLLALLLPGWYWLRALVATVPIGALLMGRLLSDLFRSAVARHRAAPDAVATASRAAIGVAVSVVIVVSAFVSVSLAVAGPGYHSMASSATDDVMTSVRSWGSPRLQAWRAFGEDVVMWEWLNRHVGPRDRVATLEIRTYRIARPEAFLYLDGREAAPLLDIDTPAAAERFLRREGARYVAMPTWATFPPSPGTIAGILPVLGFLGTTPEFPAVAAFAVGVSEQPSVVYSVGPTTQPVRLALRSGRPPGPTDVDTDSAVFPPDLLTNRIFVPSPWSAPVALSFVYDQTGDVRFDVRAASADGERRVFSAAPEASRGRWREVLLPLPPSPTPVVNLTVTARRADLVVDRARVVHPTTPLITSASDAGPFDGSWRIARGEDARVSVPVDAGRSVVSFRYSSEGSGRVAARITGAEAGAASDRWKVDAGSDVRRFVIETSSPGFVTVTLRSNAPGPIVVREIDVRAKT